MINSDLQSLYQEVILDHNKRPRNFRVIDPASSMARGHNPLCGDQIQIYINMKDDIILDVSFQGQGCAISTASASLMTDAVKGKSIQAIKLIFDEFHQAVTQDNIDINLDKQQQILGRLMILTGVKKYPSRVKCATLAWHALQAAIVKQSEPVKTE
ncbi:iron-sulfur cluster assembly scaffold protein [Gammaproteobacteria bacterium]|nr:iron-sulfur cluster assembly scaffold protein [Gammaproteobacteria bacterium]